MSNGIHFSISQALHSIKTCLIIFVKGQLLKLRKVLKPLRVYSEQMEMLEFPYPGSNLKLSRRSIREERPKRELRSANFYLSAEKELSVFILVVPRKWDYNEI